MKRSDRHSKAYAADRQKSYRKILLFLLFPALFLLLYPSRFVQEYESLIQRSFHRLDFHLSADSSFINQSIVILKVTENAYPADLPKSPLDRNWLAELLKEAAEKKPETIVFNILLDKKTSDDADQKLAAELSRMPSVILRSEPGSAPMQLFSGVVSGSGTLQVRHDLDGYVQSLCSSDHTCRGEQPLVDSVLPGSLPENINWQKLQYHYSYPELDAGQLKNLKAGSLKGKTLLIGVGFEDIYHSYRTPYEPEVSVTDTYLLAQALSMAQSKAVITSVHWLIGIIVFVLLLTLQTKLMEMRVVTGWLSSVFLALLIYSGSAFLFIQFQLEFPVFLTLLLFSFHFIYLIIARMIHNTLDQMKLELDLKESKINLLTNELHKHHLFNEFSRMSVMITRSPAKAKEYLVEFAELLRISLQYADQMRGSVKNQVDYLMAYIRQQEILQEDKLEFTCDIPANLPDIELPWNLFYTFLENAVKYAEAYSSRTGKKAAIVMKFNVLESEMVFSITNPFLQSEPTASTGTGLKNLSERLKLLDKDQKISLSSQITEDQWKAVVTVKF